MRREITAFPSLDHNTGVITWRPEVEAICKAQQIEFMLDKDYDPKADTERLGMEA